MEASCAVFQHALVAVGYVQDVMPLLLERVCDDVREMCEGGRTKDEAVAWALLDVLERGPFGVAA